MVITRKRNRCVKEINVKEGNRKKETEQEENKIHSRSKIIHSLKIKVKVDEKYDIYHE